MRTREISDTIRLSRASRDKRFVSLAEFGADDARALLAQRVIGEVFQMLLDTFELTLEPLM
jgi:hypothetical protein